MGKFLSDLFIKLVPRTIIAVSVAYMMAVRHDTAIYAILSSVIGVTFCEAFVTSAISAGPSKTPAEKSQ